MLENCKLKLENCNSRLASYFPASRLPAGQPEHQSKDLRLVVRVADDRVFDIEASLGMAVMIPVEMIVAVHIL